MRCDSAIEHRFVSFQKGPWINGWESDVETGCLQTCCTYSVYNCVYICIIYIYVLHVYIYIFVLYIYMYYIYMYYIYVLYIYVLYICMYVCFVIPLPVHFIYIFHIQKYVFHSACGGNFTKAFLVISVVDGLFWPKQCFKRERISEVKTTRLNTLGYWWWEDSNIYIYMYIYIRTYCLILPLQDQICYQCFLIRFWKLDKSTRLNILSPLAKWSTAAAEVGYA